MPLDDAIDNITSPHVLAKDAFDIVEESSGVSILLHAALVRLHFENEHIIDCITGVLIPAGQCLVSLLQLVPTL